MVEVAAIALIATIVAALAAVTVDAFFRRVSDPDEIAEITDVPVVGVLPRVRPRHLGPVLAVGVPDGDELLASCALDLRTNVMFGVGRAGLWRKVAVVGVLPLSGTTTTVVNMAVGLAELGARVQVVDAAPIDNARETLATVEGQQLGIEIVRLGSSEHGAVHAATNTEQPDDRVIVDSPPVSTSPAARVLAVEMDATILVVPTGTLRPSELRRRIESLETLGVTLGGIVLARAPRSSARRWTTTVSDDQAARPPRVDDREQAAAIATANDLAQ